MSLALLVVLETLSPAERAVFVLREVFGLPSAEVAAALDRTEAAVRQMAHRAREHVQARQPRFDADRHAQREVTERFFAAVAGGDIEALLAVLAPDVVLISDGGGKAKAARRPIAGADKVARFLVGHRAEGRRHPGPAGRGGRGQRVARRSSAGWGTSPSGRSPSPWPTAGSSRCSSSSTPTSSPASSTPSGEGS